MDVAPLVFLFILGAVVGSFVNVVILRFGFRERSGERSHCAACGVTLRALDLVPIVSYFALRGRCRSCGSALALQYPAVEALVGALFVLVYITLIPTDVYGYVEFLAHLGFWTTLVALVVYDLKHTLVPMPFVYVLTACAALNALFLSPLYAVLGAVVCGGFFALISIATRGKGMGIGDAYIAAAIGLMLGLESGIVASVLGVWIGAVVGIVLLIARRHVTLKSEFPFAPFLAVGALVAFVTGIMPLDLGFWLTLY